MNTMLAAYAASVTASRRVTQGPQRGNLLARLIFRTCVRSQTTERYRRAHPGAPRYGLTTVTESNTRPSEEWNSNRPSVSFSTRIAP